MILYIFNIDGILALKVNRIAIDIYVGHTDIDIQTTKNVCHFIGGFLIECVEACQLIFAIGVRKWERKCIVEFCRYIGVWLV